MPFKVHWEQPQSVLYLQLVGHVTHKEFIEVDREITYHLNSVSKDMGIALVVDVNDAKSVPQDFKELKESQTYATSYNTRLRYILVVCGNNKLMRLMMMLTYNLCRPNLQFFDTPAQAMNFLAHRRHTRVQNDV